MTRHDLEKRLARQDQIAEGVTELADRLAVTPYLISVVAGAMAAEQVNENPPIDAEAVLDAISAGQSKCVICGRFRLRSYEYERIKATGEQG